MVKSLLAFGQNGAVDWLWQRISAVILGLYVLVLMSYIILHPSLDFTTWHTLFSTTWMRIFTFLALLCLVIHSWIGIWTVLTDYIKPLTLRLLLQIALVFSLIIYMVWGIHILWSL
jgi:succinate dehydrogenase / fumarate reductase membrane anchor subunit